MKTLKLTLKKKWFKMIESGVKKEEYREIKNFWLSRLCGCTIVDAVTHKKEDDIYATVTHNPESFTFKPFGKVEFRNGYHKDAPRIVKEIVNIRIGTGKEEWGAENSKKYFVIEFKN